MFSLLDHTGYVIDVSKLIKSSNDKEYYDIKLRKSPDSSITIRIMKKSNPGVHRQTFVDVMKAGKPVTFVNINRGSNVSFFNSFRNSAMVDAKELITFKPDEIKVTPVNELKEKTSGSFTIVGYVKWAGSESTSNKNKRVRDGVFQDGTGHMPISVWDKNIDDITDSEVCYEITDVTIRHYFGVKLATTPQTNIISKKSDACQPSWENVDINQYNVRESQGKTKLSNVLEDPEILSVNVQLFPICIHKSCSKKVNIIPAEPMVTCSSCDRSMLAKKCKSGFTCLLSIEKDEDKTVDLTVFADTLTSFLETDVLNIYKDDVNSLKMTLLSLENISITYNNKNVITKIEHNKVTNIEHNEE